MHQHAKVTLLAPDNVRGEVHGSQTGKNYAIAEDGTVVVDAPDAGPLVASGGWTHPVRDGSRNEPREASTSEFLRGLADELGGASGARLRTIAAVFDQGEGRRREPGTGQENHDHGGAIPPRGEPGDGRTQDPGAAEQQLAGAASEVDTAESAEVDTGHRSQIPGTGHMGETKVSADDQAAVRDEEKREGA